MRLFLLSRPLKATYNGKSERLGIGASQPAAGALGSTVALQRVPAEPHPAKVFCRPERGQRPPGHRFRQLRELWSSVPQGPSPVQASVIHSTLRVCSEARGLWGGRGTFLSGARRQEDNLAASKSTRVRRQHQEGHGMWCMWRFYGVTVISPPSPQIFPVYKALSHPLSHLSLLEALRSRQGSFYLLPFNW